MYTAPGPAISRLTWSWFLPQNEQWYWTRVVRLFAIRSFSWLAPRPKGGGAVRDVDSTPVGALLSASAPNLSRTQAF
jgi:hypothetical protein